MKFSGKITVAATREEVFLALRDTQFFASCIDGVRDLTPIDDTHFDAVLETKVAYMSFRFKVAVIFTELAPPHTIAAKIEGAPMGLVGRLSASTKTTLVQDGHETTLHYDIETALTGKLGSIGQPVLKSKAKDMEREFSARLRARFAALTAEPSAA